MSGEANLKGFTVRGGIESTTLPAAARRAIEVLENLPFKELLTTKQLATAVGVGIMYFRNITREPGLEEYRFNFRASQVLWGSKRTITELKRVNKDSPL